MIVRLNENWKKIKKSALKELKAPLTFGSSSVSCDSVQFQLHENAMLSARRIVTHLWSVLLSACETVAVKIQLEIRSVLMAYVVFVEIDNI